MTAKGILFGTAGNTVALVPGSYAWNFNLSSSYLNQVVSDGSGAAYITGWNSVNYTAAYVIKLNPLGTTAYKLYLNDYNTYSARSETLTIDSSNNVYIGGSNRLSTTIQKASIIKLSTNNTITWQKNFYGGATCAVNRLKLFNNNVYAAGRFDNNIFIICYNSSGVVVWKTICSFGGNTYIYGLDIDSTGNIIICGTVYISNVYYGVVAKLNSSGTFLWQKQLSQASSNLKGCAVDSAGNIVTVGDISNSTQIILKLDTNGGITWQYKSDVISTSMLQDVKLDATGNIYAGGSTPGGTGYVGFLVKFNSSGTLQWQRTLSDNPVPNNVYEYVNSMSLISADSVFMTIVYDNSGYELVRVPIDGSKTGSYGKLIYSTSTSRTYSTSTYSLTANTPSILNLQFSTYFLNCTTIDTAPAYSYYVGAGFELSNGNSVGLATGFSSSSSAYYYSIVCRDSNSNVVWAINYGSSTAPNLPTAMVKDSADNIYFGYQRTGAAVGVVKLNSAGVVQWSQDSNAYTSQGGVCVDGSGNVYLYVTESSSTCRLIKFNSSGTLQWERRLSASTSCNINKIATDPTGNIYVTGTQYISTTNKTDIFLVKYNLSGTLQWKKQFYTSVDDTVYDLAVDASGNCHISIWTSNAYNSILKIDTNGTKVWGVTLSPTTATSTYLTFCGTSLVCAFAVSTETHICVLNTDGTLSSKFSLTGASVGWIYGDGSVLYIGGVARQNATNQSSYFIKSDLSLVGSVTVSSSTSVVAGTATIASSISAGSYETMIDNTSLTTASPTAATYNLNGLTLTTSTTAPSYTRNYFAMVYTEDTTPGTVTTIPTNPSLTTIP